MMDRPFRIIFQKRIYIYIYTFIVNEFQETTISQISILNYNQL